MKQSSENIVTRYTESRVASGALRRTFVLHAAMETAANAWTEEELEDYFASGARLVWIVDPTERHALVYGTPEAGRLLRMTDALDGEEVVPGFHLSLAELFAELSFE